MMSVELELHFTNSGITFLNLTNSVLYFFETLTIACFNMVLKGSYVLTKGPNFRILFYIRKVNFL